MILDFFDFFDFHLFLFNFWFYAFFENFMNELDFFQYFWQFFDYFISSTPKMHLNFILQLKNDRFKLKIVNFLLKNDHIFHKIHFYWHSITTWKLSFFQDRIQAFFSSNWWVFWNISPFQVWWNTNPIRIEIALFCFSCRSIYGKWV